MDISPAVGLSWQLAAWETILAEEEFIQPDHLFLGCLKLVSLQERTSRYLDQLPREAREAFDIVSGEIGESLRQLRDAGVEADPLRHTLRERRGKGCYHRNDREKAAHRSEASLRVFRQAQQLAEEARSDRLLWHHLLIALLQQDSAEADARRFMTLEEAEVEVRRLRTALSRTAPQLTRGPESYEERESQEDKP